MKYKILLSAYAWNQIKDQNQMGWKWAIELLLQGHEVYNNKIK